MCTSVWRSTALACLAALVTATAQGQAGSLSGSIDRGNARSSSGMSSGTWADDEGWYDDEAYLLDDGRVIQRRPTSPYPRPDPRNVGRRLPPGLGLGIGSNIGSDVSTTPGIGAGIGADTRVNPQPSASLRGADKPRDTRPHKPYRPRDRERWPDDTR